MIDKLKNFLSNEKYKRARVAGITVFAVIVTAALTVVVASALTSYNVTVSDGEQTMTIATRKTEPLEVLEQAGLELGKDDMLDISRFVQGEDCALTVYRACNAKIAVNGKSTDIIACGTVKDTLKRNKVTVGENDYLSARLDALVYEGMTIVIERAFGVEVTADGKTTKLQTVPVTVEKALKAAGIKLGADDETVPSADTLLSNGMKVEVLRVKYSQRCESEKIKFSGITKKSGMLYTGTSRVSQQGADGEKEVTYRDKYVNGVLTESEVVSEKITKKPIDKITLIGTKKKIQKIAFRTGLSPVSDLKPPADLVIDADGIPKNYSRVVDGTATAYTGGGTTASGRPAMTGHIAVNPKQFPYGTKLYVVSLDGKYIYGYCIAADTGGFARTGSCTIDIYMDTVSECYAWGRRGVRIYVL